MECNKVQLSTTEQHQLRTQRADATIPLSPPAYLVTGAWELHSRFSPILTFQTDQHEGQHTDHSLLLQKPS